MEIEEEEEEEGAAGEEIEEEGADGKTEEEIEWEWATHWFQQQGMNKPVVIPERYYPCKFHFGFGRRGCKYGDECSWSHAEIFQNTDIFWEMIQQMNREGQWRAARREMMENASGE